MPSRASSSVKSLCRDSAAALVCGGRSSGWACLRFSLRRSRRGGCCLMSSWAGKSKALSALRRPPASARRSPGPSPRRRRASPRRADRSVVVQVRQHEEQGQLGWELGGRGLRRCVGFRLRGESALRYCLRSDGPVRGTPRSAPRDSFNQLLQVDSFLFSRVLGGMG